MAEITLKSRKYGSYTFIIDDDQLELLNSRKWSIDFSSHNMYPYMRHAKTKKWFHRELLGVTDSKIQVDHINRDTLDNRKSNLRICPSGAYNAINRPKQKNNTSGYKGVFLRKDTGRTTPVYRAAIRYEQRLISLGHFGDPKEAAKAYDKKAKELFGEFAYLNFPEEI